ncbi:MAG: serine/threonine protein kinase [Planctomycetes bacterium]|nr:serine/threonine protein kinase [Planctomycetota bacterium]
MPSQKLTCPSGHSWEHTAEGELPADLSEICPTCTAARQETVHPQSKGPLAAAAPASLSSLRLGQVLAGFEIIEELSRGGMGIIYKARQQGLNRLVALKVVSPERLGQADTVRRFQREVQAAALLSHPNIVTVFATDLTGPWPYLAMEYVPGIDLFRLVKQGGPLSIADACFYILQAAQGLQHAFEQGLVHRDIKPANLMITPSPLAAPATAKPRVKILDFGLARVQMDMESGEKVASNLTLAGQLLGTPDYMAPEQAEDPRNADIRADLFSLGGTFYFLLTGEVPFPTPSLMQKLGRLLTQPAPSAAARRPDVPSDLDALIRKLMARDPADRFQTPAELIEALEAFQSRPRRTSHLASQPAPAVEPPARPAPTPAPLPPSLPPPSQSQVRAHANGVQSLAISGDGRLLLSGGLDETLRLWDPSRLRETRCLTGDVGPVEQVCLAPSAKWVASCSMRLMKKDMVVQLWDLATGSERRRLRGHTDSVICVAIAPDGRGVAAGGADRTVRLWVLDQPAVKALCLQGHTDTVRSVVFLPEGTSLLSGSLDGTIRLWDAKTGALKGTVNGQVGRISALAFGGPSKRVAIAGEALQVRRSDGSFTPLLGHEGSVLCVAFSADGRLLVSGGSDGTVRLWRTEDGEELACFRGHTGKVNAVVLSPDARAAYSGGADGMLRCWPPPT